MSNYYEENKEAIRERARKYYYSHKDKCKQYRERNKKRISERYRIWYRKRAEKKKYAREAKRLQNEKLCERNKRLVDKIFEQLDRLDELKNNDNERILLIERDLVLEFD